MSDLRHNLRHISIPTIKRENTLISEIAKEIAAMGGYQLFWEMPDHVVSVHLACDNALEAIREIQSFVGADIFEDENGKRVWIGHYKGISISEMIASLSD